MQYLLNKTKSSKMRSTCTVAGPCSLAWMTVSLRHYFFFFFFNILPQGIQDLTFPTMNWTCFPLWWKPGVMQILYHLSHQGSPLTTQLPGNSLKYWFFKRTIQTIVVSWGSRFPIEKTAAAAAAAAKSLQSCPTPCNPIDGSPPGPAVPGIL